MSAETAAFLASKSTAAVSPDAIEAVAAAHLRYVSDTVPGITRVRRGTASAIARPTEAP